MVLARAAAGSADRARLESARTIPVAALLDSRHRRCGRRPARARHPVRDQLAGPVHRIPLPAHRHRGVRQRRDRAARGDRAVEHPRRGADRHRYVVTCNGYPMPLLATDNPDIHVGGVRSRAWQPPSALHPSITVDGPLQFELVDLTTGTSRGGCTYHIAHPGGRAYDEPPVNAVEAESRRARRFEATGFTPGKLELSDVREMQARISTDIGAPGILDLRRVRTVLQ